MMATSTGSPCAACKFLRRKCTSECVFAPYFPPEDPHKFINVHKVFGASNVSKILNELTLQAREDAVNSLAYEADARVKDPVYGCVGAISILQSRVVQLQAELAAARSELCRFKGLVNDAPLHYKPPSALVAPHQTSHLQAYPSSSTSAFTVNSTQDTTPSFSSTIHVPTFAHTGPSSLPSKPTQSSLISQPSFPAPLSFSTQARTASCTLPDCSADVHVDQYASSLDDSLSTANRSLGFPPHHHAAAQHQDSTTSSKNKARPMHVGQYNLEPQS